MNKKKLDRKVTEKELKVNFKKLYPIFRTIIGDGFFKSLEILNDIEKINFKKVKSGTNVLDWKIPKEWMVSDAFIIYRGKKIIDLKKHNLHIVSYSTPINTTLTYEQLKKHLYTLPKIPNAIPYVQSYYDKKWGFCLTHNQFKKLDKKGKFKVVIKSSFKNGYLHYSNNLIKGKSKKEILLYTYLCHSQMANHELGGPLLWIYLYKIIKNLKKRNYSYRFVCAPENIGAATFLHYNKKIVKNIVAGYIINCVGNGNIVTYKKSRIGNSLADKAALNVINFSKFKSKIVEFFPDGSDERQFCSPGFNLPIGLVMRKMYGEFKEYHNSLDNEKFINFKTIIESLDLYLDILNTLENNFIPIGRIQYGTPMLSKIKNIDLYPKTMDFSSKPKSDLIKLTLDILNKADGNHDLLDICANKYKLNDYKSLYDNLIKSKLIRLK